MVALSKPTWVSHDEQPIFSVDVHPDGARFATAGNDHRIKLWSLRPCTDEAAESDDSVPRLLATLSGHLGAVNCARWSPDGLLLASGSDDQLIMLWRLAAPGERLGAVPFGSGAPANIEKWRCVATLRGHTGDVVGVAWSPDSRRVASVSLDNSVRVWDAASASDPVCQPLVAVLQGHRGMAKGLAWDPIGRYVSSQGDDRAVVLWDTRDWKEVTRVEEPFQKTSQKTLFRRLCWSPDGQFLCCPHAFKRPVNIAVVLRRPASGPEWVQECDFVGHSDPVVCAAFNPRTFRQSEQPNGASDRAKGGPKGGAYTCCALGGQDCTLSIWLTASPKALIVIRSIFEQDVLDLSWTPDGYTLLACSMDGTLACVRLEPSELGVAISADEQRAFLTRLYGDSIHAPPSASLAESTALLALERQRAAAARAAMPSGQSSVAAEGESVRGRPTGAAPMEATAALAPSEVIARQREVRTKEGRRRIMPVSIDQPAASASTCVPAAAMPPSRALQSCTTSGNGAFVGLCAAEASSVFTAAATSTLQAQPTPLAGTATEADRSVTSVDAVAAAPAAIASASAASADASVAPTLNAPPNAPATATVATTAPAASLGTGLPTKRPAVCAPGAPPTSTAQKRAKPSGGGAAGRGAGACGAATQRLGAADAFAVSSADLAGSSAAAIEAAITAVAARTAVFAPAPTPSGPIAFELLPCRDDTDVQSQSRSGFAQSAFGDSTATSPAVLEARAVASSGGRLPTSACTLRCTRQGECLWTAALPSSAVLLTGNSAFAAVGTADRSVTIFTPAGRRALPTLRPSAGPLTALVADMEHALMLVGSRGEVIVWQGLPQQPRCTLRCCARALVEDSDTLESPSANVIAPCADRLTSDSAQMTASSRSSVAGCKLLSASLLPGGKPILVLPHGVFSYCQNMQSWLCLGDEGFAASEYRSSLSSFAGPARISNSQAVTASLAAVQFEHASASGRFRQSAARFAASLASTSPEQQQLISVAHLEHQIVCARALGNAEEYREWMRIYSLALAQHQAVRSVRELCDELLGPLDCPSVIPPQTEAQTTVTPNASAEPALGIGEQPLFVWQPSVLGLCKRTLLRETVLPALSTNRSLQRILAEYVEQLDAVQK